MKKFLFLMLISIFVGPMYSQCEISSFIEENYAVDGGILALREILSDPSDPDYNNPFIPYERVEPYLEKLSAIHANPDNNPRIDSLFNEFQFHVNPYYSEITEYNLVQENNFIGAFLYYFIGLVISRFGSLIIGSILQIDKLKFIKFADQC